MNEYQRTPGWKWGTKGTLPCKIHKESLALTIYKTRVFLLILYGIRADKL